MKSVVSSRYNWNSSNSLTNPSVESTACNTIVYASYFPDRMTSDENEAYGIPENGKYSVFDIANWFLHKQDMTHKKLQKLCYYAQAWCYALKGYKLINADFQAWVHGPVCPVLYERFKGFGYETIALKTKSAQHMHIDNDDLKLLEDVWDTYGEKSGNALEALSHREIPWIEARRGYSVTEKCTVVISPESMKKYYRSVFSGD